MDYKELSNVKIVDSERKVTIDTKKKVQDALEGRKKLQKVEDSKSYKKFKISDKFKSLKKKIKDELMETETTEAAVDALISVLEEQPAEQVLAAAVEVLAEAIDVLQTESEENPEEESEENPEEESEENPEEESEENPEE